MKSHFSIMQVMECNLKVKTIYFLLMLKSRIS